MVVDYSLSDQIHASAKLENVLSVKLWLGADIMLEYELEEAKKVLVSSAILSTLSRSCAAVLGPQNF